ncbi:MAG TPA: hypothetical protein VF395_02100 [Polyangiaceae bacterium]
MLPSHLIDVVVGLVLLYALLSVVASALLELVASALAWRAKDLESALRIMLGHTKDWNGAHLQWFFGGGGFSSKRTALGATPQAGKAGEATTAADRVLSHPLVGGAVPTKGAPSYVSSQNFALAVFDVVTENAPVTLSSVSNALRQPGKVPEELRRALQPLVDTADSLEKARANVEHWFDSTMDRLSGLYKRRTQAWLIGFGLVLAGLLNLDSFSIARELSSDSAVAAVIVNAAQQDYAASQRAGTPAPQTNETADETVKRWHTLSDNVGTLTGAGFSVGWDCEHLPSRAGPWIAKILGILITGLTTSVGAATWFAALGQILALRSAVQPKKGGT